MKEKMDNELAAAKQAHVEQLEEEKRHALEEREAKEKWMQDEHSKLDQKRQEVEETARQARLSMTNSSLAMYDEDKSGTEVMSGKCAAEDAETDIGDSVSVAMRQNSQAPVDAQAVEAMVREQTNSEVQRLMAEHVAMQQRVQEQFRELQEKNESLEKQLLEKDNKSEVSALDLSPPANGTPNRDFHAAPSPLSGISGIDASPLTPASSAQKSKGRDQRRYSLIDHPVRSSTASKPSGTRGVESRRLSVAHDAMISMYPAPVEERQQPVLSEHFSTDGASSQPQPAAKQRKWWAEQRQFLMEDLYSMNDAGANRSTPTPTRNQSGKKNQDSAGRPATVHEQPPTSARKLGPEFEAEAQQDSSLEEAENVEWVCDAQAPKAKRGSLREPQVHYKKGGR